MPISLRQKTLALTNRSVNLRDTPTGGPNSNREGTYGQTRTPLDFSSFCIDQTGIRGITADDRSRREPGLRDDALRRSRVAVDPKHDNHQRHSGSGEWLDTRLLQR